MKLMEPLSGMLRHARAYTSVAVVAMVFMGGVLGGAPSVYAGFGITPPYVLNDRLTRGTTFDQKITLVRSDALEDLQVEVTMNLPGVESWFTVDKGLEFTMPKGVTQMPIVITVHVPSDASYEQHKGSIRIRTSSAGVKTGGSVSIALGAQVDVDIKVVDKIYDFTVRRIRIADLEEGRLKWGLFFPGKIRFFMTVENTGNTEFGPTKVKFEIYDGEMENLLETTYNTNAIERITPFVIKEIVAELPTRLPAGRYMAKYTIYKNNEIAQQNQFTLGISALGAVAGYTGYGFDGLSVIDKAKVISVFAIPLLLLIGLVVLLTRKTKSKRDPYAGQRTR